jgi:phenylacetate-coenzyme A ligase PaaK-like adenylate-forming protein
MVYREKIKEYWGRYPLDLYAGTEGSVMATQAWDYSGMTFIPDLNFLEFIPEEEQLKLQVDRSYRARTLLLSEVKPGEKYELIITNFHGGVMTRYRIGDMVRILSLSDDKLDIKLPQMCFERRVDDFIDFYTVNFTERSIWQAIESSGVDYEDWIAYKDAENLTLNVGIELRNGYQADKEKIASALYNKLARPDENKSGEVTRDNDITDIADFKVKVNILPKGTFAGYIARKQAEGADLAHLKPPHVNPPQDVLSSFIGDTEETIVVKKSEKKVPEKEAV